MRRRLFLRSGSAAVALALGGCGGGGGDSTSTAESALGAGSSSTLAPATEAPVSVAKSALQPASGVSYPFGARLDRYAAGIKPTQSASAMDAVLTQHYDAWKAALVVSASPIVPGGYAVQCNLAGTLAVSEGMGYGMLLTVLFAGHDPQARTLFDGMLAVVRTRFAYAVVPHDPNGKYLMDWKLYANGSSAGEGWNAMDGDLDIAMALLMADRQWGSGGTWNYLQEAKNTIGALKSWNMKVDGTTKGLRHPDTSRTSDYMIGHFRAFKAATGDALWDRAVDRAYALIDRMQTVYSPGVGLMPDFIINTNTEAPIPSTGYMGDGNDKEGLFWWNACRNPWRFASDYLLSGDPRFALVTGKMIDFFKASSGGDPVKIGTGYALDGTMLTGGNSAAYHGPICAGACVDGRFQAFLDAMWNWNAANPVKTYYDAELQLLSMVVASGNWWTPAKA
jgi:endo-1,4-beta-D-glucanase Y